MADERAVHLHLTAMQQAVTVAGLASALEAAAPFLEQGQLADWQDRLQDMRKPFDVVVTSLGGASCTVQVSREQTVGQLREEVGRQMGRKAYRVQLAHEGEVLQDLGASLEDAGVVPASPAGVTPVCAEASLNLNLSLSLSLSLSLLVVFGEVDPVWELSVPEILAATVKYGMQTALQAEDQRVEHAAGRLSEAGLRARFAARLAPRLEEEACRRREADEVQQMDRERRASLLVEWLARARSSLECLGREELQLRLRAVEEGIGLDRLDGLDRIERNHGLDRLDRLDHDREGLLWRLAMHVAVATLEKEAEGLRAEEAGLQRQAEELGSGAERLRQQIEREFAELEPSLHMVRMELAGTRKVDIVELRAERRLHQNLHEVLAAVLTLTQHGHSHVNSRTWDAQRRFLAEPDFLQRMLKVNAGEIPSGAIRHIEASFIQNEKCRPDRIKKMCRTLAPFSSWVHVTCQQHQLQAQCEPLVRQLQEVEGRLAGVRADLGQLPEERQDREEALRVFRRRLRACA